MEVFTQRNFVADFIVLKFNFILKHWKSGFEQLFGGLRSNVRTPSIARWKARGRLSIRHNWTFSATSYGGDVISGNLSKSAFLKGGRLLWAQISDTSRRPPTTVGVSKLEWLPFSVVSKYPLYVVRFLSQSTHATDRQTDRPTDNYDSHDRANITASRGYY